MPRGPKSVTFVAETTTGSVSPAYTAGDEVGGAGGGGGNHLEFTGVAGYDSAGEIKQVVVTLQTATAAELDLVLYNASYTRAGDNVAFAEQAADMGKCVGVVNIPAAAFKSMGGNVKRAVVMANMMFAVPTDNILRGQLVTRGALTLTDVTVHVGLGIERA